jgi:hypothetical protein
MPPKRRSEASLSTGRESGTRRRGKNSEGKVRHGGQVMNINREAGMVWRGPDDTVLAPGKYTYEERCRRGGTSKRFRF